MVMHFLAKHHKSLKRVLFSGVIFSHTALTLCEDDVSSSSSSQEIEDDVEDICTTMQLVLKDLRAVLKEVDEFKMLIHRRDEHDVDHLCASRAYKDDCDGTCEKYLIHNREWLHRSELEKLAEDLGVTLDGCDWDFGKFVMKAD